ncbi:guanine nucleotide exchange factor VAV2-like isoform X2 [Liolophura sinensis]|uniref:guanine nucleotide exchange factor VAV2-like isoform X2 n=1 Tax=Liolophura sinensis TaxID=3198878 RepID=UPI003158D062
MASEEWRMCADWLVKCTILPADHRALKPNAQIFDLAQALRDGVLLCHLLNNLSPGSVDVKDFSARPQMSQFLCLKNIRSFLQTCKNVFGLRDCDLFDPYDLFDVKDFKLVLHTLSKISKSEKAQRRVPGGFPPDNRQLHDHDYYNTLEEIAAENDMPDMEDIYDTVYNGDEDEIYEDLCMRRKPPLEAKTLTKKEMCIKELVDTEKNYVSALEMIVTHFIKALRNVMRDADRDIIFAYIEELYSVHSGFHSELCRTCHNMTELSEVFITWKQSFLIYGDFCSNLPKAQEHIEEICKRNEIVKVHIEDCQRRANDGKFKLRDLLHLPMQRVLKYHLLLKELIKQTDKNSDEKKSLERALEAMQDLSFYVNEVKRDNETLQLIREIQNSIVDLQMPPNTFLKDYGRLQKDGELRVRSHPDNRLKSRYIFLFDKVMLMCKSRGETYSYKDALVLGEYMVEESAPTRDQPPRRNDKYVYSFMIVKKNRQMAYTFFAKTDEVRKKWIEAINLALNNGQPVDSKKVGMEFTMHTFSRPKECDVCGKLLRGVFYQGYYCQERDLAVHKECISKAKPGFGPPVPPRPLEVSTVNVPRNTEPYMFKARAKQNYIGVPKPPGGRTPLEFNQSDVIEVLSKESEEWWEGRLKGEQGAFPANFVTEIKTPKRKPSYINPTGPPFKPSPPNSEISPKPVLVSQPPACHPTRSYANIHDLTSFPWFVGEMSRETAAHKLSNHRSGTFLIRESDNEARKGEFSLSIKYCDNVKHIKVERTPENTYYIADVKYFHSLRELVEYYQQYTLSENFPDLETTLKTPIKNSTAVVNCIGYAVAAFDYAATATNQLTLHRGDRVKIISKAGGDKGWWKGEKDQKIGYFPLAYVTEESD